ncbi:hypothetical protein [Pseudarthrobacter sp. LMD1-1-1.1]|uniref:hypothetical protein n=1 Tax=Pseudarthrobacter sp. LMD1-1-1.1 TaxID=3135242 RepID=UPI0034391005
MFASLPERYETNVRRAASFRAKPAVLLTPDGGKEPAVMIRQASIIQGVLPVPEALRLANQIADALAAHREGK